MQKILWMTIVSMMLVGNGLVFAAAYNIKQMTPEVEQALQNRKARFSELEALKVQGALGENNKGYVEVLNAAGQADQVAGAENADRQVIYQTIAEQNDIADQISVVEQVFAQVQLDKAQPGYQVQLEDGSWVTK